MVGVPDITPVLVSRFNPGGKSPVRIDQVREPLPPKANTVEA